ncbi:DMT family transporter [Mycobacterium sp.]|uniref:DMT family transporter n=1 Tax=Mycobacterium sp. TaxID=1785 RepID=UPI002D422F2A|nr:DMT family transporter [Mycobacterium sp.]HZA09414.1 DMT family transporter [Mycobacterium sp.]
MIGVALALLSGLSYGVSDFIGGIASRRVAALRVVLVSYPVAMVILAAVAAVVGGHISAGAIVWGALCGVAQAFGVWWFYAALAAGPISVVSPLTAVLVAAIPVVAGVALGERPGLAAVVGVLVALVAVVLVSRDATDEDVSPHRFTHKVAWLTVGSGIAFGLNFVVIRQAPADAALWPLVFARMSATVLVIAVAAASGNLRVPPGRPLQLGVAAGLLDTFANVCMILALRASLLSLAGVLISLYPAATVVLAMVLLGERVTRTQRVGMVLAGASVAMIAAG